MLFLQCFQLFLGINYLINFGISCLLGTIMYINANKFYLLIANAMYEQMGPHS